jgi:hypothetical protein
VLSYTRDTAELEEEKIMKTEEMNTEGKEKERPKVNTLKEKSVVNYKRNM